MKEFLLSIIGVVMLGTVVDISLPTGKISKFIKSIFGIFIIVILISPIPKLLNQNYDFGSIFYDKVSTEIDSDFLDVTYSNIVTELEESVVTCCSNAGFNNIKCKINYNVENSKLNIENVICDIKNMSISQNMVHINKYAEIEQAVKQVINIEGDKIIFDE